MFVRMTWTQAKEQFDAHEDFIMTSGNNSNPITSWNRYYARDYWSNGITSFRIVLESLAQYANMNINCWKEISCGKETGTLYYLRVYDMKGRGAVAYVEAENEEEARKMAKKVGYEAIVIKEK